MRNGHYCGERDDCLQLTVLKEFTGRNSGRENPDRNQNLYETEDRA